MATQADLQRYTEDSGRDWNQLCMALISHYYDEFGTLPYYAASAIEGYYASKIESYDAYSAPVGATIWLDIGAYGHVMFRAGDSDAQGTSHVQVPWGINAGLADLAWYVAQTGATPLGWSWDVVGGSLPYEGGGGGPTPTPTGDAEAMSFVKISGKAGQRRGGTYAVFDLGGGAFTAIFIGNGGPQDLGTVDDDAEIAALQRRISGLA